MKSAILLSNLLACLFLFNQSSAQDVAFSHYDVTSNESIGGDITCHSIVKNLSSSPLDLVWNRYWMDVTSGWEIAICDPNQCWTPDIEQKPFSLAANDSGLIDVHFYSDFIDGYGWSQVNVFESGNPTNSASNFYYASEGMDFSIHRNNLSTPLVEDTATSESRFANTDSAAHDYTFEWAADDLPSDFTATVDIGGQALSMGNPVTINVDAGDVINLSTLFVGDTAQFASVDVKVYRDDVPGKSATVQFAATNYSSSISTKQIELSIFPNPVTAFVYVKMNGFTQVKAEIFDVIGRPVGQRILSGYNTSYIGVNNLDAGLYFVRFSDMNNNDLGTQSFKKVTN